jgi:hypothetical protein
MTAAHKTPGNLVTFKDKVFESPYTPCYDQYKGLIFEVVTMSEGNHVTIRNIADHSFVITIHPDEIKTVSKNK